MVQVVTGLGEDQKRALLKFVTSCSRPPLLGFKVSCASVYLLILIIEIIIPM